MFLDAKGEKVNFRRMWKVFMSWWWGMGCWCLDKSQLEELGGWCLDWSQNRTVFLFQLLSSQNLFSILKIHDFECRSVFDFLFNLKTFYEFIYNSDCGGAAASSDNQKYWQNNVFLKPPRLERNTCKPEGVIFHFLRFLDSFHCAVVHSQEEAPVSSYCRERITLK